MYERSADQQIERVVELVGTHWHYAATVDDLRRAERDLSRRIPVPVGEQGARTVVGGVPVLLTGRAVTVLRGELV